MDPRMYPAAGKVCSADDIETAPASTKLIEVWTPDTNERKLVAIADLATQIGATTSTAAELNFNDGSVAGTAVASKTLVLGSNKEVDTLVVAALKLGAGAGTAVTATAAEINALAGVTAGTVAASKALVVDANKDVASVRNLTGAGRATFATCTLTTLPTSDPTTAGALWNDSGTVKISAG